MDDKDKYKLLVLLQNASSSERRSGAFHSDLDPNSSPPLQDALSFCSVSNLKSSIVYLAQELQNLGFRYKIVEPSEDKLNLVALVNACWDVIQLYHSAVKDGNTLHDSRRRDAADINHLQGSVRDLKCSVEEKERLLLEAQEKERQVNAINKALATKLKAEKDDVKRLNSVLQQREIQHQHENRKKEIEMNKLQDRLHRFVSNERGAEPRIPSISMTSSLTRSDRARGRWRTDNTSVKQEEELYRRVLGQYEAWVGQLTEETDLLKEFMSTFSAKISKLALKCANSQLSSVAREEGDLNDSLVCSVLSADGLDEDPLFSLNFITTKDRIQKMLDDNLQVISQSVESKDLPSRRSHSPDPRDIASSIEKNISEVVEGICVEKESEVKDQLKLVLEVKKKLQQEREIFAAAAVKLNRERANFEVEKVELLRHQFLEELPSLMSNSGTPFTPNTSLESPVDCGSLTDLYGDAPHCIPADPILTSPTGSITHTTHPITLGPTRLARSHRDIKLKSPKGESGLSAPSTRNSSLSRSTEMRFLHEVPRSKTLERPTRSACHTPYVNDVEESVSYSTRSLSRPGKRKLQLTLPNNINLSHSINCPPLEDKDRVGSTSSDVRKRSGINTPDVRELLGLNSPVARERLGITSSELRERLGIISSEAGERFKTSFDIPERFETTLSDVRDSLGTTSSGYRSSMTSNRDKVATRLSLNHTTSLTTEENISYDSGFSYDHDDSESQSYAYQKLRNAQTNSRLNALESSLMNLLDQINAKEKLSSTCPGKLPFRQEASAESNKTEVIEDESSRGLCFVRKTSIDNHLSKPRNMSRSQSRDAGVVTNPSLSRSHSRDAETTSSTSFKHAAHPAQQPDIEKRSATLQGSTPGSVSTSRKSSSERKTGEYFLKKIQNNFTKFYWK